MVCCRHPAAKAEMGAQVRMRTAVAALVVAGLPVVVAAPVAAAEVVIERPSAVGAASVVDCGLVGAFVTVMCEAVAPGAPSYDYGNAASEVCGYLFPQLP